MNDSDLNFNTENADDENKMGDLNLSVFRFDVRSLVIWVLLKWRWIAVVFFVSLAIFWSLFKYQSIYSFDAWTAETKILHQSRSDTAPSFYKPATTNTVLQFLASQNAMSRAANRMQANPSYKFSPTMMSNVEVSVGKSKNNMITISASASTPQTAAALANAVAEEGIAEYVRNQNNSVRTIKEERERQRVEVDREISSIEAQKKLLYSKDSGLPPDMEFQKKRTEFSQLVGNKAEALLKLQILDTRIADLKAMLKEIPQKVEYETILDKSASLNIKEKESALENLKKRYTDENPKLILAREEIAALRKAAEELTQENASRITYRKNDVYTNLEQQLATLTLDRGSLLASIKQSDSEIEKKRYEIAAITDANDEYSILAKRTDMLKNKSIKLADNISELDFLMSSAIPDVYIFEAAKEPSSSNIGKTRIKVLFFGFGVTILFVCGLAAIRIGKMRIMSAREYKISLGLEVLGEVPEAKQYSEDVRMAAIQKVARNIRTNSTDGKNLAMLKFDDNGEMDNDVSELLNICAMNGIKSFRLKCLPISQKPEAEAEPSKTDDVAQTLVGVLKYADNGKFYHQNAYTVDVAEKDLLEFDLKILGLYYDIIVIELNCSEDTGQLSSQISKLSNFMTISAPFEKVSKFTLLTNIDQIREVSNVKIGGILTNVPKPYYLK